MKPIVIISVAIFVLSGGCNNSDNEAKQTKSENDMDAARNFLDAALRGDYKTAAVYMLQDSANWEYLNVTERSYHRLDPVKKDSLKAASLRFYDTKQVNDSTTITVFANSYRNDRDTLRIVKRSGQWLVDLKYLFEHDMDTSFFTPRNKTDSIHK